MEAPMVAEDPRHAHLFALRQSLTQLQAAGEALEVERVAREVAELEEALIPTLTPEERANRMFDVSSAGREHSSLHYVGKGLGLAGKRLGLGGKPAPALAGTAVAEPQEEDGEEPPPPPPPPLPAGIMEEEDPPPPPHLPQLRVEEPLRPPPGQFVPPPRAGTDYALSVAESRGLVFEIVSDPSNALGAKVAVVVWSAGDRVPANRVILSLNGVDVAGTAEQLPDKIYATTAPLSIRVTNSTLHELKHEVVAAYYAHSMHYAHTGAGMEQRADSLQQSTVSARTEPVVAEPEDQQHDSPPSATRQHIEALYRHHNPGKLAEIPALVSKYGEARLLMMIQKKYSQTTTIIIPRAASGGFGLSISATGSVKKISAETTREAGVQLGAVIVAVSGQPVRGKMEIVQAIQSAPADVPLEFTFQTEPEPEPEPEPEQQTMQPTIAQWLAERDLAAYTQRVVEAMKQAEVADEEAVPMMEDMDDVELQQFLDACDRSKPVSEHAGVSDSDPPPPETIAAASQDAPGPQLSATAEADPVSAVLLQLKLQIYEQDFRELGVETLSDFHEVKESDLTAMGMKTLEVRRFLNKFPPIENLEPTIATTTKRHADVQQSQSPDSSQVGLFDALTDLKPHTAPSRKQAQTQPASTSSSESSGSSIDVQAYLASVGLGQHCETVVAALSRAGFEPFEHLKELQRMMETGEIEEFLPDALILMKAEQAEKVEAARSAVKRWLEMHALGDSTEAVLFALHQFDYEPGSFVAHLENMRNQAELSGFIDDAKILWQAENEPSEATVDTQPDSLEEESDSSSEASVASAASLMIGGPSAGMYRQQVKGWLLSLGYADDYHSVLSAFDRAGYEPSAWRTELQVLQQNGELDEFLRVAKGDLDDNEDRDSHRSAESPHISQIKHWLEEKSLSEHSDSVLGAFERAGYEPECWLDELRSLQSEGVLQEFIAAVSTSGSAAASPQQTRARVLFDFEKQDPQELDLKQDEVVVVVFQGDEWWTGYKESDTSRTVGEFPASYVETLKVYPGPPPTQSRPEESMSLMLPEGSAAYWRSTVREWLRDRGMQAHCQYVLTAFDKAGYPGREWVNELKALERAGELQAFVGAVGGRLQRSVTVPAATLARMISPTPTPRPAAPEVPSLKEEDDSVSSGSEDENPGPEHVPSPTEEDDSDSSGSEDENPGQTMAEGVPPVPVARSAAQELVVKMQAVITNAVQMFKQAHAAELEASKYTSPSDDQLEKMATACELYTDGIEQLETGISSGVFTGAMLSKLEARRDTMQTQMNEVEKKYQNIEAALAATHLAKVSDKTAAAVSEHAESLPAVESSATGTEYNSVGALSLQVGRAKAALNMMLQQTDGGGQRDTQEPEPELQPHHASDPASALATSAILQVEEAAQEKITVAQRSAEDAALRVELMERRILTMMEQTQSQAEARAVANEAAIAAQLAAAQAAVEKAQREADQRVADVQAVIQEQSRLQSTHHAQTPSNASIDKLESLKSELANSSLKVLKQRARSLGVDNESIDDADDEDDVKGAVIRLILAKEQEQRTQEQLAPAQCQKDERQGVEATGRKSMAETPCSGQCGVCGNNAFQYGIHHPAFDQAGEIDEWECDLCDKEFTRASGLGYGNLHCCAEFETCDWAACSSCMRNKLVTDAAAEAKRRHASQTTAIASIQKLAKEEHERMLEQDEILDQMFDLDGPENEANMEAAEELREQAELKWLELSKQARQMQRQLEKEMKLSKEAVQRQLHDMKMGMEQAIADAEQARVKVEASAADARMEQAQTTKLHALVESQAAEAERRAQEAEQTALDLEEAMVQTLDDQDAAAKASALEEGHARQEWKAQQEVEAVKLAEAAKRAEAAERQAAALERRLADMEAKAQADAIAAAKKAEEETARRLQKAEEERIAAAEKASAAARKAEQERAKAQREVDAEKAAESQKLKEAAERQAAEAQQRIAEMEVKAQAGVEAATKLAQEEAERKIAELQHKVEADARKRAAEAAALERRLADMEAKAQADAIAAAKKAEEETARRLQKAEEERIAAAEKASAAARKAEQERAKAQREVDAEKAAESQKLKEAAERQAAEAERKIAELQQKAEEYAREHAEQAAEAERKLASMEARAAALAETATEELVDEDELAGLDDLDDLMGGLDDSDAENSRQEAADKNGGNRTEQAADDEDVDGVDDMMGLDDLDEMANKLEDSGSGSDAGSNSASSPSSESEEEEALDEAAAARAAEEEMKILAMRRRGRSGVAAVATADDNTAKVQVGVGNNKFYVQQIRGWLRHRGFAYFTDSVITALEKQASIEPADWLDELSRLESSSQLKPFLENAAVDRGDAHTRRQQDENAQQAALLTTLSEWLRTHGFLEPDLARGVMTALLEASFPTDTWIQKLEDFDSGSMLDEFIAGVRRGDANAQLISARSDTGRLAWHKNAVASWLKHTGYTDHSVIAGAVIAFESAGKRPDKWVPELEKMQKNGELKVFLDAVSNPVWAHEQLLASTSRRRNGNGTTDVAGGKQKPDTRGNQNGYGSTGSSPAATPPSRDRSVAVDPRLQQGKTSRSDAGVAGVVLKYTDLRGFRPKPSSVRAADTAVTESQRLQGPPAMNLRGTIAGPKARGETLRGPPPVPKGTKGKASEAATAASKPGKTGGRAQEIAAESAGEDSMLDELGEIDGLSSDEGDSMMEEMAALDSLMDSPDEEQSEQQSEASAESDDELDMLDGLDDMLDALDDTDSDGD